MHSCIYEGQVRHRRFSPAPHTFKYKLFYVFLDLDELDHAFKNRWFWSANRPSLARFKRSDYLGDKNTPLKQAVLDCVQEKIGIRPGEKIHEVLVSRYEAKNTLESGKYFIILPPVMITRLNNKYLNYKSANIKEFNSRNTYRLSKQEITAMLKKEDWLKSLSK